MTAVVDVPELIPVRRLNGFVFCQRLFYLEWADDQWVDTFVTDEGTDVHRRVDRLQGAAPSPDDEAGLRRAQSVSLSSSTLGLVGVVDVVEAADGGVRPVEVKSGRPAPTKTGIWAPEEVQIVAHAMLLREAGYTCDEAVVYFAETRERRSVSITQRRIEAVHEAIAGARGVAAAGVLPPPLEDDPRCARCSLVEICLPDETRLLSDESAPAPRRLIPTASDARPLYVNEQGATVGVSRGRLQVRKDGEELASLRLIDISQVNLHGRVQISTQALSRLFSEDVPVAFFSYGGWFHGIAHGHPSRHARLRMRQVAHASHGGLRFARELIRGKILNSRVLLRRNAREDVQAAVDGLGRDALAAADASSMANLLGIEGGAARRYFSHFTSMLRQEHVLPGALFEFEGRNRRPPRDAVNALLSYAYALLVKDLTAVCLTVGLDPYIGVYHRPRFGRPALALDLAEEFRPLLAESVVVQVINNGEMTTSDFRVRAGGVGLTASGRRTLASAYERRIETELQHPKFGYRAPYRRLMETQVRLLAAALMGDVPRYEPLVTR